MKAKEFNITWGENAIDIMWNARNELFYGTGWIKDISGDDIAKELNDIRKEAIKKFIDDRFIFVHVN